MTSADHPFAGRRTRILSVPDVAGLLDMEEALRVQRDAFLALAAGRVTSAPNAWLRLPDQERRRGWLKLLAGHEADSGSLGVKVLARFADNPPGANLGSLVILFDDETGFPLALMDGVLITALRTGAGAGLASAALAKPGATGVGVVGTGVVAWYSLMAIARSCPDVASVKVFSRSEDRRQQFAARAHAELGLEAQDAGSVGDAVAGQDIVITGTNAPEPVLEASHLEPGQHINAMGIRTEISPKALAATWVVPDGVDEAVDDGKFSVALAAGTVTRSDLGPGLGQVLSAPVPHESERITLFDSSGVAVQDVTMARRAWELAEDQGIGTVVDLGLDTGVI